MQFLNKALLAEFRETINSSSIFEKSDGLKEKYNLICVVMDRLESAMGYLNKHDANPRTEEDFVCFLVYACMIRDGIVKLYENVFRKKPDFVDQKKYFKHVKQYSRDAFTEATCPTDEVFFEYLRSMAFAHPFETGNRKGRLFLERNETQYCPWVIVQDNYVGIRVYTSSDKFIINDLTFPFDTLKEYIKFVYEHLKEINKWAKDEIYFQDEAWKKHKIDRSGSIHKLLQAIKEIYTERFLEPYEIERIESYVNCECTNPKNEEIVQAYRGVLTESLYKICDALDACDYDALGEITDSIFLRPSKAYSWMHYHLEKIYCYLDDDHHWMDIDWGLRQAKAFSKEFAKDWVTIEVGQMSFDEIKLLVTIACYYETKRQGLDDV